MFASNHGCRIAPTTFRSTHAPKQNASVRTANQKSPRKGSIRFRDDACSPIISMGRAATAAP
jgi:hypothetical protein